LLLVLTVFSPSGGVHRDGENSLDVSADLTELGRTPCAVVCAGCKSILDIGRTIEYLVRPFVLPSPNVATLVRH
jgi:pseudouridine-5'-phosphate glycosidase